MSQPRKKRKKKKNPAGPHLSAALPLPLFCSARRGPTRRRRRRPFSGHVPAILVRRAQPSLLSRPYPRPADPVSPQTLTLAFPSSIAATPKPCRRRDSPAPVSCGSIRRSGSFFLPSSSDSGAHPASFASLQGRRRAGSPRRRPCLLRRTSAAAPRPHHRR